MYALALPRLLHSRTDYIEPPNLFTHGYNFVAGSSIVRTRPPNHAWDHCGETSAYKTTQRPLLYPCLNEWDVLMWSIRLCNSLGEASPYKVTWLHRLRWRGMQPAFSYNEHDYRTGLPTCRHGTGYLNAWPRPTLEPVWVRAVHTSNWWILMCH